MGKVRGIGHSVLSLGLRGFEVLAGL
jgi:hypothetical protein